MALTMGTAIRDYGEQNTYWQKLLKGIHNNTPEVIDWLNRDSEDFTILAEEKRLRMVKAKFDRRLLSKYLYPWTAKQGCALWFEHTDSILSEDLRIWVRWIMNASIIERGVPRELFELAPNFSELSMGKFNSREHFFYRFDINRSEGLGWFVLCLHQTAFACIGIYPKEADSSIKTPKLMGEVFGTSASTGIYCVH